MGQGFLEGSRDSRTRSALALLADARRDCTNSEASVISVTLTDEAFPCVPIRRANLSSRKRLRASQRRMYFCITVAASPCTFARPAKAIAAEVRAALRCMHSTLLITIWSVVHEEMISEQDENWQAL